MSNFLQKLNAQYDTFTRSHRTVANYLNENLNDVAFCTLEEIADRIGVSTTTIIRFSRALGYSGYSDMQKDIQSSLQTKASLPERLITLEQYPANTLLAESFQNDILNIQHTLEAQNDQELQRVIHAISSAPNVYVLGMRSSFSVAHYMASRLSEIRENIHLIQSVGMLYPEEIVSAKEGDIILPCAISSLSYKNSYAAPLSLSNYLIAAIAQENYEESQKVLEKTESILNQGFYLGL